MLTLSGAPGRVIGWTSSMDLSNIYLAFVSGC